MRLRTGELCRYHRKSVLVAPHDRWRRRAKCRRPLLGMGQRTCRRHTATPEVSECARCVRRRGSLTRIDMPLIRWVSMDAKGARSRPSRVRIDRRGPFVGKLPGTLTSERAVQRRHAFAETDCWSLDGYGADPERSQQTPNGRHSAHGRVPFGKEKEKLEPNYTHPRYTRALARKTKPPASKSSGRHRLVSRLLAFHSNRLNWPPRPTPAKHRLCRNRYLPFAIWSSALLLHGGHSYLGPLRPSRPIAGTSIQELKRNEEEFGRAVGRYFGLALFKSPAGAERCAGGLGGRWLRMRGWSLAKLLAWGWLAGLWPLRDGMVSDQQAGLSAALRGLAQALEAVPAGGRGRANTIVSMGGFVRGGNLLAQFLTTFLAILRCLATLDGTRRLENRACSLWQR